MLAPPTSWCARDVLPYPDLILPSSPTSRTFAQALQSAWNPLPTPPSVPAPFHWEQTPKSYRAHRQSGPTIHIVLTGTSWTLTRGATDDYDRHHLRDTRPRSPLQGHPGCPSLLTSWPTQCSAEALHPAVPTPLGRPTCGPGAGSSWKLLAGLGRTISFPPAATVLLSLAHGGSPDCP